MPLPTSKTGKTNQKNKTATLKRKKPAKFNNLTSFLDMVPRAGVEPAQYFYRGILSPLRLPISPPGHSILSTMHKIFSCNIHSTSGENGGGTRSRTEVDGFAIHCIATLLFRQIGAGNEDRTRDPNLGKVVLYR